MSDTAPAITETVALPVEEPVAARLALALGGQYEVVGLIGRGGFAEVYRVLDRQLDRTLAIKVMNPGLLWAAGSIERFREEARAVARLDHPNILPIHFVGEGQGLLYYAMPLVDGVTLTEVLRREGALPVPRAVEIASDLLAALAHAHAAGLVHRDIKPDNVMLDARGRTLLVDFGIAKRLNAAPGATQAGFVVGTPAYMSPEQALGQPDVDHRADLYAVGAVLFQMLAGTPPYEGEDSQEVAGKHVHAPVPTPSARRGGIPEALAENVVRALSKDRKVRFQDALEMRAALGAETPTRRVPAGRGMAPARVAAVIVVMALLIVAALGMASARRSSLMVLNRLGSPIGVITGADAERRLAPGDSLRVEVARDPALQVSWYAVPAKGVRNQPLGEELQRSEVIDSRKRVLRLEARADGGVRPLFQPLITNTTGQPLTLRINVGSAGERSCRCTIPAGARRVPIGFYPLYANSSVRAIAPNGRVATFSALGPKVDRASGEVRLRFDATDFRDTTVLRARVK